MLSVSKTDLTVVINLLGDRIFQTVAKIVECVVTYMSGENIRQITNILIVKAA